MPVPVPTYSKLPAHPVIKINQAGEAVCSGSSLFQSLTHSLPLPPSGPPPSFSSREEWIRSLPSWRQNKPRRIWEEDHRGYTHCGARDFDQGLTVAGNAAVIKGAPAQACIPPVSTLIATAGLASTARSGAMYTTEDETDDDMSSYSADMLCWRMQDAAEYDRGYPMDVSPSSRGRSHDAPRAFHSEQAYERGAFTPVFEELSPEPATGNGPSSSPIGPSTPFAEFVDRAVEPVLVASSYDYRHGLDVDQHGRYSHLDSRESAQCHQCHTYQHQHQAEYPVHQVAPVPEPVVTPTATLAYRKLAEPLSEWIASYVWKVCTTGLHLPHETSQRYGAPMQYYSAAPPSYLASSTHSMLLSTLLQPSAIFLALWYIVRLPVVFGLPHPGTEGTREKQFRVELLGNNCSRQEQDTSEAAAPYRLILLGCMLANKWLDDHTFSNKTWHTISNVPVHQLNQLEALALSLFDYNLSISSQAWSEWLSCLLAYHCSPTSPSCPQPISRPSTSPHTIIRKAIETLVQVPTDLRRTCQNDRCQVCPPEPIFLTVEDRSREQSTKDLYVEDVEVLEIDLDEDGPLREEYLPRRRISGAGSAWRSQSRDKVEMLPPPAKWSPAADELVNPPRPQGPYIAPRQAQYALAPTMSFHQSGSGPWLPSTFRFEQDVGRVDHVSATSQYPQSSYLGCTYESFIPLSHSRSQSLAYGHLIDGVPQSRLRSYSQSRFDGVYNNISYSENQFIAPSQMAPRWSSIDRPAYTTFYDRPFERHLQHSLKV